MAPYSNGQVLVLQSPNGYQPQPMSPDAYGSIQGPSDVYGSMHQRQQVPSSAYSSVQQQQQQFFSGGMPPVQLSDPYEPHWNNNHQWSSSSDVPQKKDDDEVRIVQGANGTKNLEAWKTFDEVRKHFPGGLVDILTDGRVANFTKPTNVQAYSWPSLLAGEDIIGIAKTGSGKTLAFLLPGFIRVKTARHDSYHNGPKIVVLAPTRELCQQIYGESEKFGEPAEIYSACAYGGADRGPQLRKFRQGPHVAIGCPGRLLDYLEKGQVRLDNADYFVLDEADRMLDMGFEPQIRSIIRFLPPADQRQNCLFSATWPKEVQQIARSLSSKPAIHIQVGTADSLTANADITQHVIIVDTQSDKWTQLQKVLTEVTQKNNGRGSVLIFSNTKRGCADLAYSIQRQCKCPASALHGDMDQRSRDYTLQRFKDGKDLVMVATDVAQRGLDVRNVSAVVNWEAPSNPEDYVHRIGRTGRGGDRGEAYAFLFRDETKMARHIMKLMQKSGQVIPQDLSDMARDVAHDSSRGRFGGKGKGFGGKSSGKGGKGKGFSGKNSGKGGQSFGFSDKGAPVREW
eukprot:GEMP01008075.1.p1 GENE.GEMP01008075.1~~GEMP01008075.1.p1  ORF type:complete len:569 (+),score=133.47 GEMP01008075.1:175-1881(+)